MKKFTVLSFLIILAWSAVPLQSDACSCMPPDINRSYRDADEVAKIRILGRLLFSRGGNNWYIGAVVETFKGCREPGQWVIVETPSSSAACGLNLTRDSYLLNGSDRGSLWSIPIIGVGLCGYNRSWGSLSDSDLDYLYSRYNCCGDECSCTDGSEPVNCFVDPCMVSECADPEATCSSNYCGGCRAEWYDAWGGMADCEASCKSDEDCADGTWCRENQAGQGECVSHAGPGESCEGFVLPWKRERCAPNLTCAFSEPTHDVPGTCAACVYDGTPYQEGDKFSASDGCNTCVCTGNGGIACTEMACFPTCDPAEEKSCADEDLVCMAETVEETGMCQPFAHGTTVGAGYGCGGSIGVSCAEGLFCQGLPTRMIGGTGVCALTE